MAPSVGLLFFAGVIGTNTASVGVRKQAVCGFGCLVAADTSIVTIAANGPTVAIQNIASLQLCWCHSILP
jgi:hypothetical protein